MAEINEKVEKILINTNNNSLIFEPSEAPAPVSGEKSVRFFDYDGTLVTSYTADEFASLAAMPENPTHELLTARGWNYSLADAQAYVAKYGALDIGQMYKTTDGATKIFCTFGEGRLDPTLYLGVNGTVTIDWGDNSTPDTMTGSSTSTALSQQHIYAAEGDYVISILPEEGTEIGFIANSSQSGIFRSANANRSKTYLNSIKRVYIGADIAMVGSNAFQNCYGLQSITIPDSVTSIGSNAFQNCYGLGVIKFSSSTPPSIPSSSAWTGVPTDCKIYVPTGTLEIYTMAANYPPSSTYTYVEYDPAA